MGFGDILGIALSGQKKPKVPTAPYVDPQAAQMRSIQGNANALPQLESLSSDVNTFNRGERQRNLEASIPGFAKLSGSYAQNLQDWMNGRLSPSVESAVNRSAAAKALRGGFSGSGMQDAMTARDLGLTSLDLQRDAASRFGGYMGTMSGLMAPEYQPQSGFLSPAQQINTQQWNEENRFGQSWLKNQVKAAPDPLMQAVGQTVGGIADTALAGLMAWAGGGLGGMAGGAAGASAGSQMGAVTGGGPGYQQFGSLIGSLFNQQ